MSLWFRIQTNKSIYILCTLPIFHFFELFKKFWHFIWLGYCLNRFIALRRCSNDARKNQISKILKNYQGYEECEDSSHSSYPCEFFSILGFRFFRISFDHLLSVTDLVKQHPSHMMPQKILKSPKKWRFGRVRRMWGFLTFFVPLWIF